jgi:hypothetical protein
MRDEAAQPEHDDDQHQKGTSADDYVTALPQSILVQELWSDKDPI